MSSRRNGLSAFHAAAATLIACLAFAQKAEKTTTQYEYRVIEDVEGPALNGLAEQGWEFAGYLGQGVKGVGNDQTLWRRPTR
jgi:hypothetical protein